MNKNLTGIFWAIMKYLLRKWTFLRLHKYIFVWFLNSIFLFSLWAGLHLVTSIAHFFVFPAPRWHVQIWRTEIIRFSDAPILTKNGSGAYSTCFRKSATARRWSLGYVGYDSGLYQLGMVVHLKYCKVRQFMINYCRETQK